MRRVVLIDGENLNYAIRKYLGTQEEKAPREVLTRINYRGLIEEVLETEDIGVVMFFGVRMRKITQDEDLERKTTLGIRNHAKVVSLLQKQKIEFHKVGNLRVRVTDPCKKCGSTHRHLAEKGVDVGMAVKMLEEANQETEIIVVSSDTDLLPAIRAAKRSGAKITFVGYDYMPVLSLAKLADSTRMMTQQQVKNNIIKGKNELY